MTQLHMYFLEAPEEEMMPVLPATTEGREIKSQPNSFVKHEFTYEPIRPEPEGPEGPVIAY